MSEKNSKDTNDFLLFILLFFQDRLCGGGERGLEGSCPRGGFANRSCIGCGSVQIVSTPAAITRHFSIHTPSKDVKSHLKVSVGKRLETSHHCELYPRLEKRKKAGEKK